MNAAEADLAADRWPRACVEVVGASLLSLDWFEGTSTGNHGFPVNIPLNQSNDPCLLVEDLTDHTRLPAYSAVKWNAPRCFNRGQKSKGYDFGHGTSSSSFPNISDHIP